MWTCGTDMEPGSLVEVGDLKSEVKWVPAAFSAFGLEVIGCGDGLGI